MRNHLVYVTFGENTGTVYETQVIELLNRWIEQDNWKVTLIQIASSKMFSGLKSQINQLFIKRKRRILLNKDIESYAKEIFRKIGLDKEDVLFFNSRGVFAYCISKKFIEEFEIKHKVNNLDIRGISEEFKYSLKRRVFYPYIEKYSIKAIKDAKSITTVSSNLRKYLIEKYGITQDDTIRVIPTLSIMEYRECEVDKKDVIFIGKVAWVSQSQFKENILTLNNILKKHNWKISIIGSNKVLLELEEQGIDFLKRMSPEKLYKKTLTYHSGLVIRDTSIVNEVSAPCKVSDYLCLGLPVIYAGKIGSIIDFLKKFPELSELIIDLVDLEENSDSFSSYIDISNEKRKELSNKAKTYFGANSVVESYLDFFNE